MYVAADAAPSRSAVLVRDGRIVFVGDPREARRMAPAAAPLDLTGTFVFPGWTDTHGHLSGLGQALEVADLKGASDSGEATRRIAATATSLPESAWAQGRGWDQNRWPGQDFPDAADLDKLLDVFLADHRREQRHLGGVQALADAGPVAVHQPGQQDLVQAGDELVLEGGPELVVFQVRVHSRKRARHGGSPQRDADRGRRRAVMS